MPGSSRSRGLALGMCFLGLAALSMRSSAWAAAPSRGKSTAKRKTAVSSKTKAAAKGNETPKPAPPVVVLGAKVAMFPFSGDNVEPVRRQVLTVLRGKGLKVNTSLRSVDSPEQFREMALTLGLVAYVDGEVSIDGAQASATVHLRSGTTGLRIASATFSGDRYQVPSDVGKGLWPALAPALGRACADAAKPRKQEREPMRINAGTPLPDTPRDGD